VRPRRILIVCNGVLGTGGGSTCAHALFGAMIEDGLDARYLVVIEERDEFYFRYVCGEAYANPDRLPGVACCVLEEDFDASHPGLAAAIAEAEPDVVLAVGDQAAVLAARHAPGAPVVLYLTGADEVPGRGPIAAVPGLALAVERAAATRPADAAATPHPCWSKEAARGAYLIVTPSEAARRVYAASFPTLAGKIHPRPVWPAEWLEREAARFAQLRRPWRDREVDAVLVANRWTRPLKNLELARRLAARSRDLAMVLVGEGTGELPGARGVGLLPARAAYLALLGSAKAVVSTSRFEASATPLYEAAIMGCNVVASRDCGNAELCDEDLLSAPDDADSLVEKLAAAVRDSRPGGLERLTHAGSYDDLIETLAVVG
jgi:glycosyltransferase involved in cell wall biosynthesis